MNAIGSQIFASISIITKISSMQSHKDTKRRDLLTDSMHCVLRVNERRVPECHSRFHHLSGALSAKKPPTLETFLWQIYWAVKKYFFPLCFSLFISHLLFYIPLRLFILLLSYFVCYIIISLQDSQSHSHLLYIESKTDEGSFRQ